MKDSSYQKLKHKVALLERELYLLQLQIHDANAKCDELDVPRSESGAFVGHRLYWYIQGKRQSHKTKKNTEGYPPEEFEKMMKKFADIRKPPVPVKEKFQFSILDNE